MKKSILAITFILICSGLAAQPPMGGGGGGRPSMMNKQGQNQDSFMIMGIPEIPDLTLEQREKLGKEITNERKDISKLMQEKQELKIDSENPGMAEKDRQKLFGKMAKIDEKIKKKEEKYDKKYRSILSDEQYNIFSANKKNIEFRGQGIPNRGNRQQPPAQRPDDNGGRPDMADDDMF